MIHNRSSSTTHNELRTLHAQTPTHTNTRTQYIVSKMGAPTRTIVPHTMRRPRRWTSIVMLVLVLVATTTTTTDARDTENAIASNEITDDRQASEMQRHQMADLPGGEITGERTLRRADSPYLLRSDLEVAVGGKLIVEPGVTVHVAPMVGITVFGALLAMVSQLCKSRC